MRRAAAAALALAAAACVTRREAPERRAADVATLPYLDAVDVGAADADKLGVMRHDAARAQPGLNLVAVKATGTAYLLDMNGRIVHEWRLPGARVSHVVPAGEGRVLAIGEQGTLALLDRSSQVVWRSPLTHHHDIARVPGGGYVSFEFSPRTLATELGELRLLDDALVELDPDGVPQRRHSVYDWLGDGVPRARLAALRGRYVTGELTGDGVSVAFDTVFDVLHSNAIQVLPDGAWLISARDIDTVAILDPRTGAVAWRWGPGVLDRQHHPTMLPGGTVLVFDNGWHRGWSRVIEVDPRDDRIVWSYEATPREAFFTRTQGSAQRLANGNTLITESLRGRAFEVTADGDLVWEYFAPVTDGQRVVLDRMIRVSENELGAVQ